jgi:hypothetical protein
MKSNGAVYWEYRGWPQGGGSAGQVLFCSGLRVFFKVPLEALSYVTIRYRHLFAIWDVAIKRMSFSANQIAGGLVGVTAGPWRPVYTLRDPGLR